jgi:hypothetical protein
MQAFDEYAALARHLHELHRAGERTTARAAARRDATSAGIDELEQRLGTQQQRLAELAHLIGEPHPELTAPAPRPPLTVAGHLGPSTSPAYPEAERGLAGESSYPELPAGPERIAVSATPAPTPSVPGPRLPTSDGTQAAEPQPGAAAILDPDGELELGRRAAAAADEAAAHTESLAQQPALLPGSSPLNRALVVYIGFVAVGNLAQALLAAVAKAGLVGGFTLYAWSLAGLPAVIFFAAYFALGSWGRPRLGVSRPARYAKLGFALCFVTMAITSCFWTSLFGV